MKFNRKKKTAAAPPSGQALKLLKTLTRQALKSGIMLLIIGAGTFGVYQWASSLEDESSKETSRERQLRNEQAQLEEQKLKAEKSLELYSRLVQRGGEAGFSLDRQAATRILNELNDKYLLTKLSIKVSPVTERQPGEFNIKTGQIVVSTVELSFFSISDEMAYGFLNELMNSFPGYVNITNLMMTRSNDFTPKVFEEMAKGVRPGLVSTRVTFDWLGLKEPEEEGEDGNAV